MADRLAGPRAAAGAPAAGPNPAADLIKAGAAASIALLDLQQKLCPRIEDNVVVEVTGQPGASKQRLYFLALAAANGIVRRYNNLITANPVMPPPYGMLKIEYDAADHWVRCTLAYSFGTLNAAATPPGPRGDDFYKSVAVYNGPECDVQGGDFNFVAAPGALDVLGRLALNGIPNSSTDPRAPKLEFKDRVILTACPKVKNPKPGFGPPEGNEIPSPNPRPPGDNRSRGAVVAEAVANPLPGTLTGGTGNAELRSGGASFGSRSSSVGPPSFAPGVSGCCEKSLKLIPLVFSALSDPGSFDQEVFPAPQQGVLGS